MYLLLASLLFCNTIISKNSPVNTNTLVVQKRSIEEKGILYQQIPDTTSVIGYACQLDSVLPFEADIVDDIETTFEWKIDTVISWWYNWQGWISPTNVPNVHVHIYNDNGNIPEDSSFIEQVIEAENCIWIGTNPYILTIDLNSTIILPGQTKYWIEIQPSNVFVTNGQTGWQGQVGIGNSQEIYFRCAMYGFTTWTSATTAGFDPGTEVGFVLIGGENSVQETPGSVFENLEVRLINSFTSNPGIYFVTPTETHVIVKIMDFAGRQIEQIFNGMVECSKTFNFKYENSGIYFYQVITSKGTFSGKIVVIK